MTKLLQSIFYISSSENPVGINPGYDAYTGFKNATIEVSDFWICVGVAIALGLLIAFCYMFKSEFSKHLVISIALLPVIVAVLIMLVNGNIGAGVAVGGVFALTRFRSAQGTAKEITHIFLSMAVGLTLGLGFVAIAIILVILVEALNIIFAVTKFGTITDNRRTLKITIPEDLNYTSLFDDIFEKYTTHFSLDKVKLRNLGTMFRLSYSITLKDPSLEKEFIDEIRTRNGNLDVLCSKLQTNPEEL
ncbi:MAG: DUF4956 domain-containing protein [Ruminococcaceae bacterium]|nr:DUF4956 domain-containing protein [Oscillospiraceae bacterium]